MMLGPEDNINWKGGQRPRPKPVKESTSPKDSEPLKDRPLSYDKVIADLERIAILCELEEACKRHESIASSKEGLEGYENAEISEVIRRMDELKKEYPLFYDAITVLVKSVQSAQGRRDWAKFKATLRKAYEDGLETKVEAWDESIEPNDDTHLRRTLMNAKSGKISKEMYDMVLKAMEHSGIKHQQSQIYIDEKKIIESFQDALYEALESYVRHPYSDALELTTEECSKHIKSEDYQIPDWVKKRGLSGRDMMIYKGILVRIMAGMRLVNNTSARYAYEGLKVREKGRLNAQEQKWKKRMHMVTALMSMPAAVATAMYYSHRNHTLAMPSQDDLLQSGAVAIASFTAVYLLPKVLAIIPKALRKAYWVLNPEKRPQNMPSSPPSWRDLTDENRDYHASLFKPKPGFGYKRIDIKF